MDWCDFQEQAEQLLARNVRYGIVAGTTLTGHGDQLEGDGDTSDPILSQRVARRMFPYGFDARPPAGAEAVTVQAGGGGKGIMVGARIDGHAPSDLEVGEVGLYSAFNSSVLRADKSGNTKINSATVDGTPGNVVVNAGTLKVARRTDPTGSGTLVAVVAQAGPTVTVTFSWVPQGGGAPVPWFAFSATGTGTPGTYNLPLPGKITDGAPHFLA